MHQIKSTFLDSKWLIKGAFIHAVLMWGALFLSYNSYKAYLRQLTNAFPPELKVVIKSTFPWSILILVALFILYGLGRDRKDSYPTIKQYAVIIVLYTFIVNLVFFIKGWEVLIVSNFSSIYFVILLLVWGEMKRLVLIDTTIKWAEGILPPIVYRPLQGNMPELKGYLKNYFKAKPSAPFIIGFMVLLMLCAFSLVFRQDKAAELLAEIAYLFLVIGVGVEIYQFIKYRKDQGG